MDRSSKEMMKGAAILTLAAIFSKILSAMYRVPFQNIVGDTGFYIYQQVYPLYGILLALCTYAFPVMVSKIVAERKQVESKEEIERILQISSIYLTIVGLVWFLFLKLGAGAVADWMGDPLLAPLIELMAYPFLLLPVLSVSKGWFQANYNMIPSAFSQSAEQVVRVLVIIIASIVLMSMEASLYDVGKGAVMGSLAGSITGVIILLLFLRKQGLSFRMLRSFSFKKGDWTILRQLTVTGTAMGMGSMMLVLYQLMDSLNVYSLLVTGGTNGDAAKILKGIYDRGQPLVQMGVVVATSLSLAVVPIIASAFEDKKSDIVKQQARLAVKAGVLFGAAAAVGLINIMEPLNIMLFQDSAGSGVLAVFAAAVLLASVILTINAVLQGMGDYHLAAWSIVASLFIKYGLNLLLIPHLQTMGAAIATVIALLFVMVMVIWKLRQRVGFLLSRIFYLRLLSGLAGMTIVVQAFLHLPIIAVDSRLVSSVLTLTAVMAGAWVFFKISWRKGLFSPAEVRQIPLGKKIERIFGEMT
ncbi:polysaccharide biosynthesis protein [Jeotgalibacillus sp. S-D1]|uniref:putative polysaccharide biosynthesis protein n=1 Tax=Jeotgalibacillus sp. S-D1 TaxID=2552189 RepID=UPI00105A7A01|nr:polysaccharide biosynthesis protein [Jeotgalibacillus sp. S-D1]TDL30418.1 polysaccharide biosynthesis protein [Jeotgalibacillus sp. S-D1]